MDTKKIKQLHPIVKKLLEEEHPEMFPVKEGRWSKTITRLIPLFYTLAVGSVVLDTVAKQLREGGL